MRDENCIFCKIIAGEIPSNTIYEDDEFKVVLDVSPASKGHALILPKNHYADLYEIDENVAADAMKLAKKLAIHMTDVLKCDGFNLVQNNHEVAGFRIPKNHYADLYEHLQMPRSLPRSSIHMNIKMRRIQSGSEQPRSGRTDSIPFPYAPDPKIPQCKEQ